MTLPQTLSEDLRALLRRAAEAALREPDLDPRPKDDGSLVTRADLAAERVLLDGLRAGFPHDAVLSEERGHVAPQTTAPSGRTWTVDPIDGTHALLEGLAHWGPTVGLVGQGSALAGALYLPRLDEYYFGAPGFGARRNDVVLPPLGEGGPVTAQSVLFVPSRLHTHVELDWPGKIRCLGSTASHLALCAAGAAAAVLIGPGWHPWDVASGLAMIEAVGGVAVTRAGATLDLLADRRLAFVAGTRRATAFLASPGRITDKRRS